MLGALALFALPAAPALAVPMCDGPDIDHYDKDGQPVYDEIDSAARHELELHGEGIDAHDTRWWNGCLQTFVTIDGRDVMKFYDPETLREVR